MCLKILLQFSASLQKYVSYAGREIVFTVCPITDVELVPPTPNLHRHGLV